MGLVKLRNSAGGSVKLAGLISVFNGFSGVWSFWGKRADHFKIYQNQRSDRLENVQPVGRGVKNVNIGSLVGV